MPRDSPTGSAQNKYANFGHKISDGEIPLNSFADFSAESVRFCTSSLLPQSCDTKCDILGAFAQRANYVRTYTTSV